MNYGVAAHGGAGKWRSDKHSRAIDGLREAILEGFELLQSGESALNVVERIVVSLEDNPNFNAGTGSSLNIDGEVEMDASIMDGSDRSMGAVAALPDVKNPITVARNVLEETDHVMLTGQGALRFARATGAEEYDPIVASARESYQKKKEQLLSGEETYSFPRMPQLIERFPELSHGTVGAVARDREGRFAAATSTGGLIMQLVGRVGDTPLPGAGTYATEGGASSATGQGEQIMKTLTTRTVCDYLDEGDCSREANIRTLRDMIQVTAGEAGMATIDGEGNVDVTHRSPHMPHAWQTSRMTDVQSAMRNHVDEL